MGNSVDPRSSVDWVYTVSSDCSVPVLRIFAVAYLEFWGIVGRSKIMETDKTQLIFVKCLVFVIPMDINIWFDVC